MLPEVQSGVVVLTHGDGRESLDLLQGLLDMGVPGADITLVHNTHEPVDPATCGHPPVTVIHPQANLGYTGGMNAGIRRCLERNVDYVLLLTHEVRLRPGALEQMMRAAEAHPQVGVIGPELRLRETGEPFSYGASTTRFGATRHRRERPDPQPGAVSPCDWLDGAALLFRREVLEQIGLMDERYFIYSEDAEICLRATRAGWGVACILDAVAEQRPGGAERPASYWFLSTRNGLDYRRQAGGRVGAAIGIVPPLRAWRVHRRRARRAASVADRRAAQAKAAGLRAGVVAYLRRRWGPPPAWVWALDGSLDEAPVE